MPPIVKRLVWTVIGLGILAFAVQGGEYGTTDLLTQRERRRVLQTEVDSLQAQVDSLRRLERRLQSDPALQERIAREEFGMVRGDRELLYRFTDSARTLQDEQASGAAARGDAKTP